MLAGLTHGQHRCHSDTAHQGRAAEWPIAGSITRTALYTLGWHGNHGPLQRLQGPPQLKLR